MHSSPAAGTAVPIPLQPVVQAPVPVPAQHPPASPQLRNTLPGTDPRGTKRAREEGDTDDREPSSEPVVKQARVEPAPLPENPEQALFEAIDAGDTAKFRSLLTQFPSLRDATDSQAMGETPLCRAARKGKIDIVNLLIELGAPVDARACNGATPLMFAAQASAAPVILSAIVAEAVLFLPHLPSRPVAPGSVVFPAEPDSRVERLVSVCQNLRGSPGAHAPQ